MTRAVRRRVASSSSNGGRSPMMRSLLLGSVCIFLTGIASLELVGPANAGSLDRWRPNPVVGLLESVALRIHWLDSIDELRWTAENSGQEINEKHLKGFSILSRNTNTGAYTCDVYVVEMTGSHVDENRTTTFGHEVLHCFGLRHDGLRHK